MDLFQNPFYLLSATPRDSRKRIVELADERSLSLDSSLCIQARSDLTNPRKRLSAELAWLPGVSPKRTNELCELVKSSGADFREMSLNSIAKTNLLTSSLKHLTNYTPRKVANLMHEIACGFEEIDSEEAFTIINEDRTISGIPPINDLSVVDAEMRERRHYINQIFKSALNLLPPKDLVEAVTVAVESATDYGEEQAPILIDDLVDFYEVETKAFFEKEEANIENLVNKIQASADAECSDSKLSQMIQQLIKVVKNWDCVAQPIQVSTKSRGLDHNSSRKVAGLVRGLAVHLYNEHGKLDFSQLLTNLLKEVFAEVDIVAERSEEDASTLDRLDKERKELIEEEKNRSEKWSKNITYEADVGAVFKDKLRISPDGIEWKKQHWDLDSITRVRWGGTKHSVNGIPTGTTYTIFFGNRSSYTSIELKKQHIYSNFTERLWKAVCVRILTDLLKGLSEGKQFKFGTAIISDLGMELEKYRWFGENERVSCRWDELVIWNGPGTFCIRKKEDKKVSVAFSYQNEDNIHILEAAIRAFWKKGGNRLSSLLGE